MTTVNQFVHPSIHYSCMLFHTLNCIVHNFLPNVEAHGFLEMQCIAIFDQRYRDHLSIPTNRPTE